MHDAPSELKEKQIIYDDDNLLNKELPQSSYFKFKLIENDNNLIVDALGLEKRIYTLLGYLLIVISCLMIFNVMTISLMDKEKQFHFLNIIGITKTSIFKVLIIKNTIMSFVVTILGYVIAELVIF